MRSMISMRAPLEILVDERGCGEVPSTVECDQRHQDSQVVNRPGHEPDPWPHGPSARRGTIVLALISETHGFPFPPWRVGSGFVPDAPSRIAAGAAAGSSGWDGIASWKKPSRIWS